MSFFGSGYGDFTQPCAASALPACYVTNTTYSGCLTNPGTLVAVQQAGIGAVVLSALVFAETAAFAGYLGVQQAWIGRRERSVLFFLVAMATLFQTIVYAGVGYNTAAIGVISSVFIGLMNASYTALFAVSIIGYNWVPEGGLRAMMISIGTSGVLFLVSTMVALTSSLGWSVTTTPHYSSAVFFMFFIWPLICMVIFVVLQLYVLFKLYLSWQTIVGLIGAIVLYGASFVLIFPYSSYVCTATSQSVSGVFFGVLLQGIAYALLFFYFQQTSQDGWDTNMVVFDDVLPGDPALAADTQRRAAAAAGRFGAPVPLPKDDFGVSAGGYYGNSGRNVDAATSYYDDPHI